jgi:glycosyltransferase involved in cell wall biosynthesis
MSNPHDDVSAQSPAAWISEFAAGGTVSAAPARIAVVLSALGAGGSERVISLLVNEWAREGRSVTLITFEAPGTAPYYGIGPKIALCQLGIASVPRPRWRAIMQSFRRIYSLRRALQDADPEVVLSFLTKINVLSLLATRRLRIPIIISERNNPEHQTVAPPWAWLRARLYPSAYCLVTMTAHALAFFPPAQRPRGRVIPNPVVLPEGWERRRCGRTITAVGRLVHQKGFDLLLAAFSEIASAFPDWTLVIWGEGEKRRELELQRDQLGLAERVRLPGVTPQPGTWIETADVFVLSSRFEGWGIVLAEAMAAAIPVVAFDCPWGPSEMIQPEVDGLLVQPEDTVALAEALRRLLVNPDLRAKLAAAARASAVRFAPSRILSEWSALIAEAAAHGVVHAPAQASNER